MTPPIFELLVAQGWEKRRPTNKVLWEQWSMLRIFRLNCLFGFLFGFKKFGIPFRFVISFAFALVSIVLRNILRGTNNKQQINSVRGMTPPIFEIFLPYLLVAQGWEKRRPTNKVLWEQWLMLRIFR